MLARCFVWLVALLQVAGQLLAQEHDYDEGPPLTLDDYVAASKLTADDLYHPWRDKYRLDQQHFAGGDIKGAASSAYSSLTPRPGVRRNAIAYRRNRWPDGRIPYALSSKYSRNERAVLARAFQEYHERTCIRFEQRQRDDYDYLYIGKIDGCFSDVGRTGGMQELSLDYGCLDYDTAIHELMHAVGFFHEHERDDRDDFIRINWYNIKNGALDQFGTTSSRESDTFDKPYDYGSIVHYDRRSFSKNGRDTIEAPTEYLSAIIGKAIDFSDLDIAKINAMYACERVPRPPPTRPSPPPPTTVTECRDKASVCWRWADRCQSPFFRVVMDEFCAYSCGRCQQTPGTSNFYRRRRRRKVYQ